MSSDSGKKYNVSFPTTNNLWKKKMYNIQDEQLKLQLNWIPTWPIDDRQLCDWKETHLHFLNIKCTKSTQFRTHSLLAEIKKPNHFPAMRWINNLAIKYLEILESNSGKVNHCLLTQYFVKKKKFRFECLIALLFCEHCFCSNSTVSLYRC